MRTRAFLTLLVSAAAVLLLPAVARDAVPPNRHDPCVRGGHDSCGTTAAGFYKVGKYGQRWYGNFKKAVPGIPYLYCIDLRFWYPSAAYRYRAQPAGKLVNRAGKTVSLLRQERIAYALWRFGRTKDKNRAAAVMLYVHAQMGDGRPGELDPRAVNAKVASFYAKVAHDAALYHGPYRIELKTGSALRVGAATRAAVRVVSATGKALPSVTLVVKGDGIPAAGQRLSTGTAGTSALWFKPASASPRLTVKAVGLPSTLPRVFAPSTLAAAPNGQRMVAPASQQVSATLRSAASKRQIGISTAAVPSVLAAGATVTDRVTITGAVAGWTGPVAARLYGPFPTLADARCDGTPVWSASLVLNGPGTYTTPAATLTRPGWYTYVETAPSDALHVGATTACGAAVESVRVQAAPRLTTAVSSQRVGVGSAISDRIHVEGLGGVQVTISAALYGPFSSNGQIVCAGTPVWSGTIIAAADGDYDTAGFVPTLPGYYTYREQIAAGDLVTAVATTCGDAAETTFAVQRPQVTTQVTSRVVGMGSTVSDLLTVTGLGRTAASARVTLWGPFANASAIRCSRSAFRSETVALTGDGTFATAPVTLTKPGVYAYRVSIAAGPSNDAFTSACGEDAESVQVLPPNITTTTLTTTIPGTTFITTITTPTGTTITTTTTPPQTVTTWTTIPVTTTTTSARTATITTTIPATGTAPPRTVTTVTTIPVTTTKTTVTKTVASAPTAKPTFKPTATGISTVTSKEVVRPGARIYDWIRVKGIRGPMQIQLYGPFATRAAIHCTGRPVKTVKVTIRKDGEIRSPAIRLPRAGLYGFRERVLTAAGKPRLVTACAIDSETTLAAPQVVTGRNDYPRYVPAPGVGKATPVRVRVPSLRIDAPVSPVGVDVKGGVLGVSSSIHRTGWWRDGAAAGASSGVLLVAGHVDSAKAGAGVFFRLHTAKPGARVEIRTAGGRTLAYRVVSVRRYPKARLPIGVWSTRGAPKLVLVTCGGPFDKKSGHYRDNVVVTAVPLK